MPFISLIKVLLVGGVNNQVNIAEDVIKVSLHHLVLPRVAIV